MTPWKIRKNYVFIHLTPLLRNYRFFGVSPIANATPRNATEHGKGEDWIVPACYIKNKAKKHLPPPLCFATAKYRGGGRRPEGVVLQKTPILSFSPPLRRKLLFLLLSPPYRYATQGGEA